MNGAKDVKALIRGGKLPERTVPVCLQADLVAEHELAERQLAEATRRASESLAGGSGAREIAERIEALRAEMTGHTISFRLRAMPRPRWKAFVAAHPPRKDPETGDVLEADKYIGVDTSTFYDALLRASVVEPALDADDWRVLLGDPEEDWPRLEAEGKDIEEGKLTDRQYDELTNAAWGLNRRDVNIPFSPAASRVLRGSEDE